MNCEHFGKCGGCEYLDLPYEDELALKERMLRECLGGSGGLVRSLKPSPVIEGYRNKMELAFGDEGKDGELALGIRKRRSYYEVATPENCVLIPGDFKRILRYTLDYFRAAGETFYHRKRRVGALRHLVLRRGELTGEALVNLSAASALAAPLEPYVMGLRALELEGKIVGVMHSVNDGAADAVKNENVRLLWGRDYYNEELFGVRASKYEPAPLSSPAGAGLKFKVPAHAFFQTNSAAAEVLYGIVREYAGRGGMACDLYCGTGTIAQIIAPLFDKVIGIELVDEAILSAKENARLNGISNCFFYAGDVQKVLEGSPADGSMSPFAYRGLNRNSAERPDVVVVDPPRDGLHPKALANIAALSAPKLVYVSCKPKSLSRDMAMLAQAGYMPVKIEAVDMFPRTPHVECVCLFQK